MKYRPLMVLGAASDVGKTLLVTALCRIFRQEGVRVAPFKAQNMALNSFITKEGREMGRAQVVQAKAAGLEPNVNMNPILLKPSQGVGCQVVLNGKVYGNLNSEEYFRQKGFFTRRVMATFRRLAEDYELILLEGAGSAVELNLRRRDLVNFSLAKRVQAACLLTADIDRGGVFAATIGSFKLLMPSERRLLQGFIINKFRGDPGLFKEGVDIIQSHTGLPVLGVVPYLPDVALPEEDSVPLERKRRLEPADGAAGLAIGVVKLPHISNFTDFDPLEQEPGVGLRYLTGAEPLDGLDVLILPGTKSTIYDLRWLKKTGLAAAIQAFAGAGGRVMGICGGFQMLGQEVRDPLGVEAGPGEAEAGLGLLPLTTTMAGEKTTTQVQAKARGGPGRGLAVSGYEIHMGQTEGTGPGRPAFTIHSQNNRAVKRNDGWSILDGRVWGTYIHGLFENDAFRHAFLKNIYTDRGMPACATPALSFHESLDARLDRLAHAVRAHLDWDRLRALVGM